MQRREIRLREKERGEESEDALQRQMERKKKLERWRRERTHFFGIKKIYIKSKKYYFIDIRKIKGICCGMFFYRKKKVV
jgi:hypothetical protein